MAAMPIAGFTEKMAEKGGEEQVRRVISLMNQMKSSVQAVPIDKDDDIEVITASFAGIPEARDDVADLVEMAIDRGGVNIHVRMRRFQLLDPFRRRDQHDRKPATAQRVQYRVELHHRRPIARLRTALAISRDTE